MPNLEYNFYINYQTLLDFQKIAESGMCSRFFLDSLNALVEEASLRPNKDLHWDLSRLMSIYYTPELVVSDQTFAKMHSYLNRLWVEQLEKLGQNDIHSKK